MKTLFRVSAVLCFLIICFLFQKIFSGDFKARPEIFWSLFAGAAVLFVLALILRSMSQFRPVSGREYEIMWWTREDNKHCMSIRYLNKNNEYEYGIIKWEGDAEFLGSGNYRNHKYFIKTNMVGLVFSSIDYVPI